MLYRKICVAIVTCFALCQVHAAGLEVAPIRVDLSPSDKIKSVVLRNISSQKMLVSVKVMRWQQIEGRETYTKTRDLVVTPPIVTIDAKDSQVIRLGLRRPLPTNQELAYRLYAHEVITKSQMKENQLNFALRLGIPVFYQSGDTSKPNLEWRIVHPSDDKMLVSVRNNGQTHAVVNRLQLTSKQQSNWQINQETFSYVLAGSERRWEFTLDGKTNPADPIQLVAKTSLGELRAVSDASVG